jgi:hypothetical protein
VFYSVVNRKVLLLLYYIAVFCLAPVPNALLIMIKLHVLLSLSVILIIVHDKNGSVILPRALDKNDKR